ASPWGGIRRGRIEPRPLRGRALGRLVPAHGDGRAGLPPQGLREAVAAARDAVGRDPVQRLRHRRPLHGGLRVPPSATQLRLLDLAPARVRGLREAEALPEGPPPTVQDTHPGLGGPAPRPAAGHGHIGSVAIGVGLFKLMEVCKRREWLEFEVVDRHLDYDMAQMSEDSAAECPASPRDTSVGNGMARRMSPREGGYDDDDDVKGMT
ncbi:hypothetical protein THAOC_28330, partial [Thalassiosira oceanica]